jgi:DNA-binding beta-propeller fold protein YncE
MPYLYVANSLTNNVSAFDISAGDPAPPGTNVDVGPTPGALVANPAGSRLYVANTGTDTVTVLDITSGTPAGGTPFTLPGEATAPAALAVNAAGTRLYVADSLGFNTNLTVFTLTPSGDITRMIIDYALPAGAHTPRGIAFGVTPQGPRLFVLSGGEPPVLTTFVLDANGDPILPGANTAITTGGNPSDLAVNPAATRLYIPDTGQLITFDVSSGSPANETPQNLGATGSKEAAVHPAGTRLYIASAGSDSVRVFPLGPNGDPAGAAAFSVPLPSGATMPFGVAVNRAGTFLYTANNSRPNVTVFTLDGSGDPIGSGRIVQLPSPAVGAVAATVR